MSSSARFGRAEMCYFLETTLLTDVDTQTYEDASKGRHDKDDQVVGDINKSYNIKSHLYKITETFVKRCERILGLLLNSLRYPFVHKAIRLHVERYVLTCTHDTMGVSF